jgi:prophage DNA circulation protein
MLKTQVDALAIGTSNQYGELKLLSDTFQRFTDEVKANFETLTNAVNTLSDQAAEQKTRADNAMRLAVIAIAMAALSLLFTMFRSLRKAPAES